MPERLADPIVFGPEYIVRFEADDYVRPCFDCGHPIRHGEQYGLINCLPRCGPCCDKEETA